MKIPKIVNELSRNDRMAMLESLKISVENTKILKDSSRILINVHQLLKLFWALKDGESLVINKGGHILTGKVKNEKLKLLPEILGEKQNTAFDANGAEEFYKTKSWVESPGKAFKNAWDNEILKAPKDSTSLIGSTFTMAIEFLPESELKMDTIIKGDGFEYYVVEIKSTGMKGYFSAKSNVLKFVEFQGKEYRF
jgi:hypothetical protein